MFMQSPSSLPEKGFVVSLLMSEGFSLQEVLRGESCSYISFSSISRLLAASPGVIAGAIFLDFRGKSWYNVSHAIICPKVGIH